MKSGTGLKEKNAVSRILLILISLFYLIPFYLVICLSLKPESDFSSRWHFPGFGFLDNFTKAWTQGNLGKAFLNNVIIVLFSLALIIIFGSICSYPLSRIKTKVSKTIHSIIIACTIVPGLTILVPLYKIIVDLHGISHYWSIILLHVTFNMPLVVFLYTGFISMISTELDDAALIDGVSQFGIVFRIIMPLLVPITITVIIVCGTGVWNDFQFSLFFLQKNSMFTLTLSVSNFFSKYMSMVNQVAAGCIIATSPLLVAFLFLQKYFIKGLSSGALKL